MFIQRHITASILIVLSTLTNSGYAQEKIRDFLKKPDVWFTTPEAKEKAANILSYQTELGGWPKNTATMAGKFTGDLKELRANFDNSATTDELRFLARMYQGTSDDLYKKAFLKGYDYILKSQYSNGGWPQYSPPPTDEYPRYITFNDDVMVRLLDFLRETFSSKRYEFIDEARHQKARLAFEKGIECIIKCQVTANGKLTAWCAQHDEKDFQPRSARSYELVSLSGSESVKIVRLLMSLEKPDQRVVSAIESAVAWFESVKLQGIRVVTVDDEKSPNGTDRIVINDPTAPPLWARFYEIGTNLPIFADRDGVIKRSLSEIGYERRNGYAWLGNWPAKLLANEYPEWRKRRDRK